MAAFAAPKPFFFRQKFAKNALDEGRITEYNNYLSVFGRMGLRGRILQNLLPARPVVARKARRRRMDKLRPFLSSLYLKEGLASVQ